MLKKRLLLGGLGALLCLLGPPAVARAQTAAEILSCSADQGPPQALPLGLRFVAPKPKLPLAPRPLAGPTPFQFVLSFGAVRPIFVLLNTANGSDAPIGFSPGSPPPGVTVDDQAGTISFYVRSPGPWFIQTAYGTTGQDILGYRVLSAPVSITAGQPRNVDIARSVATRAITFQPVDSQGTPIAQTPFDFHALLVFRFTHRPTGVGCTTLVGGFGQNARILISDVSADYSFAGVATVGRQLRRPLHIYQYSYRNGIHGDLNLANTAAQLVRKNITAYPGVGTPGVVFAPGLGIIEYSQVQAPTFQARVDSFLATETLGAGQTGNLFVLSLSDAPINLGDPATARTPDFPLFVLSAAATDQTMGAEKRIAFTSPTFTGTGDYAQSFLSVDTSRGTFDRLDVPATGQITLGNNPLFDATMLAQSCDDFSVRIAAQHQAAPCFTPGVISNCFVPYLASDASNQGSAQDLATGFTPTFKLKRGEDLVFQGILPLAGIGPVLFQSPTSLTGNYRLSLTNPGTNIGGMPFAIRTKSFFRLRLGMDGNPPALTKVQLLDGGRLANVIAPGTIPNVLRFRLDPVPGGAGCSPASDAIVSTTLEVGLDGGTFRPVTVTRLPNGDHESTLPAAGASSRFDFKLTATDAGANRLVSRFALGVGTRGPGPAAVPDTAFTVSPARAVFALPQGAGVQTTTVTVGSAAEPIDFTATSSAPWLTVSAASVVTPAALTLTVSAAGLAPGTYQGNVTIAAEDPRVAATLNYPVSLTVTGSQTTNLTVSPASLSFSGMAGGAIPGNQNLSVGSTGGPLNISVSDNAPWLSVTPATGTTPASLAASVNTAGLAAGNYNGTITITAAGAGNSPLLVPVSLTLSPPPAAGLTVFPASLSFTAPHGGPAPSVQVLAIGSTGSALNWSVTNNATFVNESPPSGVTPGATNVSINVGGLAAGTYSAAITVLAPGASPVTVPVSLTVTTVNPAAPVVNGFLPVSGPVSTQVEIVGLNFTGVTAVTFNNVPSSSFPQLPNGNLLATVPANATTGLIRVTNAGGTGASFMPFTVTVNNAPSISGFFPPSGAPGDRITITGANFMDPSQVFFNGRPSPFVLFAGSNFLSAEVPAGATTGWISVSTSGGSATSSASFVVTGSPPP